MLEPPARSHSVSSTNEVGNTLTDANIPNFKSLHGTFKGVDCVLVALPIPQAADLTSGPINPLTCDTLAPSTHTAGVRVSVAQFQAAKPPRKLPRNSLLRSKSGYVSRVTGYDRLTRLLKMDQDFEAMWVSVGRSVQLLPFAPVKSDPLWRILFAKAWPLCHVAGPGLELVCGMSSGDIMWLDAQSGKSARINKGGNLTRAAVTSIAWFDSQFTQVVAGHADGSVAIYELDREDGPDVILQNQKQSQVLVQVYAPPQPGTNPLQAFKISNAPITDLLVSNELVLATSRDGYLRGLHTENHIISPIVHSDFGGLFGISYSLDHKYLLAGGEDDHIYVYEVQQMQLLCKLVGHTSWVRRIKFDPFVGDSGLYRAASVAEDGKLLLWEFEPEALIGNSTLFPLASVAPSLPKVSQVPLTDVIFQQQTISAAGSDGRIWTWLRPSADAA